MEPDQDAGADAKVRRARPLGLLRRIVLLWLAAQACFGLLWLARSLGKVPQYVDSIEYIASSKSLEVDPYRGFVYPLFLAAIERLVGGEDLTSTVANAREDDEIEPGPEPAVVNQQVLWLQGAQLLIWAGSLAYFLRILTAGLLPHRSTLGTLLVYLLLFADPLLAHFQLAILTDGLALSASLVFCGALIAHVLGRGSALLSGAALFSSAALLSGLRVEKSSVLAATLLGSLALWWLAERRRPPAERCVPRSAALRAAGIALAGVLLTQGVQSFFRVPGTRLPSYEFFLDQRILFPYLSAVYPELPEDVRSQITRRQAKEHDEGVVQARRIAKEIAQDDPALRRSLFQSAAVVVLREHGIHIALDVLKDGLENTFTPLSFYGRLGLCSFLGKSLTSLTRSPDYSRWTYTRMSAGNAATTQVYLVLCGLAFVVCACLALIRSCRASGAASADRPRRLAWLSIVLFVLSNAFAVALGGGAHPRYAVLAHTVLLVLVYGAAFDWSRAGAAERSAAPQPRTT